MADINPWNTRSDEEEADDLFFDEEDDAETKRKKKEAQEECKRAGMLLVSERWEWRGRLYSKMTQLWNSCRDYLMIGERPEFDRIIEGLSEAEHATCYVRRRTNSENRLEHLAKIGDNQRLDKAKKGICGAGTGLLFVPGNALNRLSKLPLLVITNNHVIMDEEEAKSAEVIFDHLDDDSAANTKRFKVKELLWRDLPTESNQDVRSLDFSVLSLEVGDPELRRYLERNALRYHSWSTITTAVTVYEEHRYWPIVAFSHPHGLGKRISIGEFSSISLCEPYPTPHIKHDLPTLRGSSGASLLYCLSRLELGPANQGWRAAFVHYRHNRAVAWQGIEEAVVKRYYPV